MRVHVHVLVCAWYVCDGERIPLFCECILACVQLMWGSERDGCHSLLGSNDKANITANEWAHVGFTIFGGVDTTGHAAIYVNGANMPLAMPPSATLNSCGIRVSPPLLFITDAPRLQTLHVPMFKFSCCSLRMCPCPTLNMLLSNVAPLTGHTTAQAVIPAGDRVLQSLQSIQLGAFTDMQAGFLGSMAHVVVLHTTVTPQQALFAYEVRCRYGVDRVPIVMCSIILSTSEW